MIVGKWVKASFYVSEVLPEKHGHVRIETSAIRHRRIGMGALPSSPTVASSRLLRKPAHDEAVPDIPGNAWQLACAIGYARGGAESGLLMPLFQRLVVLAPAILAVP